MPSVYNYRHVELDKVGRGKRVIQPPGGQTADIFGARPAEPGYSSASSQAGSDVASSRIQLESDQQSLGGFSAASGPLDGLRAPMAAPQLSPAGSAPVQQLNQHPLLTAEPGAQELSQQQLAAAAAAQQEAANRSPKKTIPVLRRNPITGEIYDNPVGGQQAVVRVRQPPGGRSSGIF